MLAFLTPVLTNPAAAEEPEPAAPVEVQKRDAGVSIRIGSFYVRDHDVIANPTFITRVHWPYGFVDFGVAGWPLLVGGLVGEEGALDLPDLIVGGGWRRARGRTRPFVGTELSPVLASDLTLGAVYVQGQVGMDWQSDGVYGVSARYLAGFGTDGFDVWPHVEARAELVLQF